MFWPSAVDYRDALQHPARVFELPELQAGRAELNHLGVPRPRSGASAQVYKFTSGTTTTAVRVFLYPSDQREARYRALHDHLSRLRTNGLIRFHYHPQGIRIGVSRYPVLTMDWVEGLTLGEWLASAVRRGDLAAVRRMAERWSNLMSELRAAGVAHGDLQHDNILVVGEQLRLVDYDGMCVPGLVGAEALESGKPAYQHPLRREQRLSLELDHFAAWVIYLALRATAVEPRLWHTFVEQSDNENLLFAESDLTDPDHSPLWAELLGFRDAEIRGHAQQLYATLPDRPFGRIPPFGIDAFGDLRKTCEALPRDWTRIARLAQAEQFAGQAPPPDLAGIVRDALQRDEARRDLEQALARGDLRQIVDVYRPQWLDDWPDCAGLVLRARQAEGVLRALDAVRAAVKEPRDGRELIRVWQRHAARLAGVAEAEPLRREVESWKRRIDEWDQFLQALASTRDRAIAAAWQRLQRAGGYPEQERYRARAELALARSARLEHLDALTQALPLDEQDRLLLTRWDDELLRDCPEATALRLRWQTAVERTQIWDELLVALDREDHERVAELAEHPLLRDYPPLRWERPRLEALLERGPRLRRLMERLRAGDVRALDDAEDRACLRESRAVFEPLGTLLSSPARTWRIDAARFRAALPPVQPLETAAGFRIAWNWTALAEVESCLMAVDTSRFLQSPSEAARTVRLSREDQRRAGGVLLPWPPAGERWFVTIWPLLNLEWLEIAGPPLYVGPISANSQKAQLAYERGNS